MAESGRSNGRHADLSELQAEIAELAERAGRLYGNALQRVSQDDGFQVPDPGVVAGLVQRVTQKLFEQPGKLAEGQQELARNYLQLWYHMVRRLAGEEVEPLIEPERQDKRFADDAWQQNVFFDFLKQSYLLTARWLQQTVKEIEGLDPKTRLQADFYTRQFVDAFAPSNFLATNPRALREAVDSGGESLKRSLANLMGDLERGKGQLAISQTRFAAFTVGENIARSPGKVVYQNDLMQLIQYAPTTATVAKRPLLIVPPWINKFYILDLRPSNSFVRHAVDQGHTVFIVSWVNPDERLSGKGFDSYMQEGPLAALAAIEQATGERETNLVGYCIGGTLSAATLAYMAATGDQRVASATLLTSLTDFREAGELQVFVDDEQLELLDKHMHRKGYLESRHMAQVFNMMRDNDLIWSYVVNNYLLGREPPAFDLLYWNADATRMPAMMHSFYLRKMYKENKLIEPGGIELLGVPIDLRKVEVPAYFLSTREDHIAPWRCTYTATQLFSGPRKFVLAMSGHIAGVVNPPGGNKYGYWTNAQLPPAPDAWLENATQHAGSWWTDWYGWLRTYAGGEVPARQPGDGRLAPIEGAPGSYVLVMAQD
ncbi:MAG: class I poly(R)-hydroxyalkanoic acid synthase [Alphaproteobacteria bacterium]|nr:class I poly(R)-hydroxyalkanoic acid synthase [Alphaproteobacteria bacterium]